MSGQSMNSRSGKADRKNSGKHRIFLPVAEWPLADQRVWLRSKRANGLFDRAAPLAGLASVTIGGREQTLGRFLAFVIESHQFDRKSSVVEIASPTLLNDYVAHSNLRIRAGSVYEEVNRLQSAFQVLAPGVDFGWLRHLPALPTPVEVERSRKPIDRPDSARVLGAALEAFDAADGELPAIVAAQAARNALIITFALLFSLRLKNLTEIKLGEHLIHNGGGWRLSFSKTLKTDAAILFDLPPFLEPRFLVYLNRYRQILLGNRPDANTLWLARGGKPLTVGWASKIIDRFGQRHLGRPLHCHLFRHEFASWQILREPDSADLAASALGHTDSKMVTEVYTRSAGYEMTGLWIKKLKEIRRKHGLE